MELKNNTNRNINVLGKHPKNGGIPFRVMVAAGSRLELGDEDYYKVEKEVEELVKAGALSFSKRPKSKLTKLEIISKVKSEADVELKDTLSHPELQEKAEALGVEV